MLGFSVLTRAWIEGSLADHPTCSLIVRQVEMGVAVRMACLDLLTAERLR